MPQTVSDNIQYDPRTGDVMLYCTGEWFIYNVNDAPMGRGGMGDVLRGYSMRDRRMVAIKRVHDRYADIPEIRRRARLEAGLAFRHPNMVEMIGCCESFSGVGPMYIISNFVRGTNVDRFIADNLGGLEKKQRESRIVSLVIPVLNALEYIHRQNIVHLDIKPSNIMVENGRNVRLMDLGIALTSQPVATGMDMSGDASGSGLMGTPKYAAPEQFVSDGYSQIDARTDIYEFGVTLYELISGVNPFISNSLSEAIEKHRNYILPPAAAITAPMLEVLRRAANPDRARRYANVAELRTALQNAMLQPESKVGIVGRLKKKLGF